LEVERHLGAKKKKQTIRSEKNFHLRARRGEGHLKTPLFSEHGEMEEWGEEENGGL